MTIPFAVEAVHSGCCGGVAPFEVTLLAKGSNGEEHPLLVEASHVVLGDKPTSFFANHSGVNQITFTVDSRPLSLGGSGLEMLSDEGTAFAAESVGDGEWVTLRTEDGRYLRAGNRSEPIQSTDSLQLASWFRLVPLQHPMPDGALKLPPELFEKFADFRPMNWAAVEGKAWEEDYSTHLWIFNRVTSMVLRKSNPGANTEALGLALSNEDFRRGVIQGIYDADNRGMRDGATSGFIYSAHFYNPEKCTGGWWDIPAGAPSPNDMKDVPRHAKGYGVYYFNRSLNEQDPYQAGHFLGLAIHYLEDITQPMHCGLFPNVPPELVGTLKSARAAALPMIGVLAEWALHLLGLDSSITENWRHDNYELWALAFQKQCAIQDADYKLGEFSGWSPEQFFDHVAPQSLAIFNRWTNDRTSPIGEDANRDQHSAEPLALAFAPASWHADARAMLALAQRAVAGFLLAWADRPAAVVARLMTDRVCYLVSEPSLFFIWDGGEEAQSGPPGSADVWVLEPVLQPNGRQEQSEIESGERCPVYFLRSRRTGKYLVAGETSNGHVYCQHPDGRKNAKWIFVPARRGERHQYSWQYPKDPNRPRATYPAWNIRDLKHGKYLAGSFSPSRLFHESSQMGEYIKVPFGSI